MDFFGLLFPKSQQEKIHELMLDGDRKLNANDFAGAIRSYTQIITSDPDNKYGYKKFAYKGRGRTYALQEKRDKALVDYNKALAIDSNYALGYYYRGLLYQVQENLD